GHGAGGLGGTRHRRRRARAWHQRLCIRERKDRVGNRILDRINSAGLIVERKLRPARGQERKESAMSELKAVFRRLWRNRASSTAAIFMLATAAAVATTTFALADAALWRALPYRNASRLAMVITTHANGEAAVSLPDFHILRDKLTHARVAGAGSFAVEYALAGFGDPRQLLGRQTTAGFFRLLGRPIVARRHLTRHQAQP